MTCQHFDPVGSNGAGVPSRGPVSLWCQGYSEQIFDCCPYLQYASCRDVPGPDPVKVLK